MSLGRMFDPDVTCVNYRFVVNDSLVRPWEPMPEAGKTLAELVAHLKTCENGCDLLGSRWDYKRLAFGGSFDPHVVSYGLRSQFWIPVIPVKEDFTWTNGFDHELVIRCCGQDLSPQHGYDDGVGADEGYYYYCNRCGRHSKPVSGRLHRSCREAYDWWKEIFG